MAADTGRVLSHPARSSSVALLDLDPDLGRGLDSSRMEQARRALPVRVVRIAAGSWTPPRSGGSSALGLLVVEGLVVREIVCGGNCSAELLGVGDVIRPWQQDEDSLIDPVSSWFVAEDACFAMLDGQLTAALGQWPSVAAEIFGRCVRRSRYHAVQRAISQVRRLDQRTLLHLWHLGERFGRVTPDGIAMRLPLTHERLALLVGAHRPSLTTALRKLERAGLLVRSERHELLLTAAARELASELADSVPALAA